MTVLSRIMDTTGVLNQCWPWLVAAGGAAIISLSLLCTMDCDLTTRIYSWIGKGPQSLKGKTVWVTGSSSGIGAGVAIILAKAGCKLILSGTRVEKLNQVKEQCLSVSNSQLKEEDILILPFDMSSDGDKVPAIVNQVFTHFNQLDILILNAGRTQRAAFEEIEMAVDKDMFEVNVFTQITISREVLKRWYKDNFPGQIGVTSSVAGKVGAPYSCTYTATKHALHGYFECLRNESFYRGIRITMVCPGPVVSEIIERAYTARLDNKWTGKHAVDKRMTTDRCAHLYLIALANQMDESWISTKPVLLYYYANQYMPSVTRFIFPRVFTKERIMRMRDGEDYLKK